jgi:hypothetical protein
VPAGLLVGLEGGGLRKYGQSRSSFLAGSLTRSAIYLFGDVCVRTGSQLASLRCFGGTVAARVTE